MEVKGRELFISTENRKWDDVICPLGQDLVTVTREEEVKALADGVTGSGWGQNMMAWIRVEGQELDGLVMCTVISC